jgi:3-dehydroquinate dehydratase-2
MERRILVIPGQEGGRQDWTSGDDVATEQIDKQIKTAAGACGTSVETCQSTGESELIQEIMDASGRCDGMIINPAGLTHCIEAIRDALMTLTIPVVEVHLSNIWSEESAGEKSSIADVATDFVS